MKFLLSFALGLAFAAGPAAAFAQDYVPDLTGTWNFVEGNIILADGTVNTVPDDYDTLHFEISDQKGTVFKATETIKPSAGTKAGTHAGTPLAGQPTQLVGAVDGTGPVVVLVDVGDTTTFNCNLVDDDTMRCLVAEPGDAAMAGFLLLKREH